ncbi:MAG: phage antirepressor KilAC domain-containing protein [Prevotella sp.]|nr:phage antirepressor KilAC domain-containing protein [Prevotella sp.]
MRKEIQIFKNEVFGAIRTITNEKGETFFVGKDVAKALGYAKPQNALATHVDMEDKSIAPIQGTGYETRVTLINESGLYSLILSSKLDQAKSFKRWVTSEVLPQIRVTGGYIPTMDAEGRQLSDEEIVERACDIMSKTIRMVNSINEDCLTASQVAALWGMDVMSFNNLLMSMGIQHRKGGRWQLCEELQENGLTEVRYFYCFSLKGKQRKTRYMVWTPKGVDFLNMMVRKMPREITANVQLNFCF